MNAWFYNDVIISIILTSINFVHLLIHFTTVPSPPIYNLLFCLDSKEHCNIMCFVYTYYTKHLRIILTKRKIYEIDIELRFNLVTDYLSKA